MGEYKHFPQSSSCCILHSCRCSSTVYLVVLQSSADAVHSCEGPTTGKSVSVSVSGRRSGRRFCNRNMDTCFDNRKGAVCNWKHFQQLVMHTWCPLVRAGHGSRASGRPANQISSEHFKNIRHFARETVCRSFLTGTPVKLCSSVFCTLIDCLLHQFLGSIQERACVSH